MTHRLPLLLLAALCLALAPQETTSARTSSVLVTLLAGDDLSAGIDFDRDEFGIRVDDGQLDLDETDLVYSLYENGRLTFGFRFRELARVVDIGDFKVAPDQRPLSEAPRPDMSVLHTLYVDGGRIRYRGPGNRSYNLAQANALFGRFPSAEPQHISPQVGHVYLLRYKTQEDGDRDGTIVAFRVVEHEPSRRVTLRYRVLSS